MPAVSLFAAVKEHAPLMVATCAALLVGLGFQLAMDLKGENVFLPQFLWEFFLIFLLAPFVIAFIRGVSCLVKRQSLHVVRQQVRDVFTPGNMLRVLICFVCIYLVITVFGAVKSLIGSALTPGGHDVLFIAIERFIHGGRLPHEYFAFIFDRPGWIHTIDFFYWVWFLLMYVFLVWVVYQPAGTPGRLQYLLSFCLCWTVVGNVLAALGASAGPVFWQYYLPDPNPYKDLMATLDALHAQQPLFRTGLRDMMLSMMHNDQLIDMNGPAALPSVHVAMATLFALHSYKYWPLLSVLTIIYLVIIQLGSFLLGWHYALDGYVGAAAMVAIWLAAGRIETWWQRQHA